MEQEILKDWQKKILRLVANSPGFKKFYLTGGTALSACYLRHRISDDLDFFSYSDIDSFLIHELSQKIKLALKVKRMRFSKIYDRWQFFYSLGKKEAKIEFAKYPFKQLKKTNNLNGVAVDSEYDIAVNKLAAVFDRFDPKDFVDLYFLIPRFSLGKIKIGFRKKFNQEVSVFFLGSELSKVRRVKTMPRMFKPLTIKELKNFFETEVKKFSSEIIE